MVNCKAKVHAVLEVDQDGNEHRQLVREVGYHTPGCLPSPAYLLVIFLLFPFAGRGGGIKYPIFQDGLRGLSNIKYLIFHF